MAHLCEQIERFYFWQGFKEKPYWLTASFTATVTGKVREDAFVEQTRDSLSKRNTNQMRPTFHHCASAGCHQMVLKLFSLFRRYWAFELWLYCWVKSLHFAQCYFWLVSVRVTNLKVNSQMKEFRASEGSPLCSTKHHKQNCLQTRFHCHTEQTLRSSRSKKDIHSSVALEAQDPCFHKSFLSLDGRKSDNPWALLFMEDYEEQKTAHIKALKL